MKCLILDNPSDTDDTLWEVTEALSSVAGNLHE